MIKLLFVNEIVTKNENNLIFNFKKTEEEYIYKSVDKYKTS